MVTFGNNYNLVWFPRFQNNIVGQVSNYTINFEGRRIIPIKLNPTLHNDTKFRLIALTFTDIGPEIYVSNYFMVLDKHIKNCMIWHEIGHVHHEHYTNINSNFKHKYYRLEYLKKNKVVPEEIEADEFVLSKISKNHYLKTLIFLIKSRKELKEKNIYGIQELELRKKYIEKHNIMGKYYFAYGSNLLKEQMITRCPDHKYFGFGRLEKYRWFVNSRGFANIRTSEDDYVLGIVYLISPSDEYTLDGYEGVFNKSYEKHYLDVIVDNNKISCLVYIDPIIETGKTSQEYINKIHGGIRDANMPHEYYLKYLKPFIG